MSAPDHAARIAALLAKAQSTTFPEEADALTAKAQELMARYSIDQAMVDDAAGNERATVERVEIRVEAPYASAKTYLLTGIAHANRCRAVRSKRSAAFDVSVLGFQRDLDHVRMMYASLELQATRALLGQPVTSKRFRHAFLMGFAGRITARLEAARQTAQEEYERDTGNSTALVLADQRSAVDRAVAEAFAKARSTRSSVSSELGFRSGDDAGRRADLGQRGVRGRHGELGR